MKIGEAKFGDQVGINKTSYDLGFNTKGVVIGKYREGHSNYILVGFDNAIDGNGSTLLLSLKVGYPERMLLDEKARDYVFGRWFRDNIDCRLVFDDPTQKCVDCSISLAHKQFRNKDRLVCVSCKVLKDLSGYDIE